MNSFEKFLLISIFLFCPLVFASYSNYNSILIGDQAAGMGGAYTSLAGDGSAMAWYNPSNLAWVEKKTLSAAIGIYKKFDTQYGENEDFTRASLRVNQGFFRSLPSSTGSLIRFDQAPDWTFAFSILVPDYEDFKGNIKNTEFIKSTLSTTDESLWVGWAAGRKIDKNNSLGFSIYYTARSYSKSVVDNLYSQNSVSTLYSEDRQIQQNSLVLILGGVTDLGKGWRMGMSWRLPSIGVASSGSHFDTQVIADSGSTNNLQIINRNYPRLTSRQTIPSKLAWGLSWTRPSHIIISGDLVYYLGSKTLDLENDEIGEAVEYRSVINAQIGAEVHPIDWLKLRAGGFTNFSSQPTPNPSLNKPQQDRVDQLGFSANASVIAGNITYTFGGYYTGGRGKSIQRVGQVYTEVPRTSQTFTMLVGTSYSY